MLTRAQIENLDHSGLIDLLLSQQQRIEELVTQNRELQAEVESLRRRVDDRNHFTRGSGSAGSSSRRDGQKKKPGRPGRKPGEGNFSRRQAPDPSTYTTHQTVERADRSCPKCDGTLVADGFETVTLTDLPTPVMPEVHAYRLEQCSCTGCGHHLRAEHPAIPSDQRGATAHRLGTRLFATAFYLHYHLGLPQQKLPIVFKELFGLQLTTSAITQAARRYSERHGRKIVEALQRDLGAAEFCHTDDTSWRVAGDPAWLMGFFSEQTCIYEIRDAHRHQEVLWCDRRGLHRYSGDRPLQ